MASMISNNLPALLGLAALLALGLGLFIFNMCQAATGFRQMRSLDARRRLDAEEFTSHQQLTERLRALKAEYERLTADWTEARRQQLWAPVDEMVAVAVTAILAGNYEPLARALEKAQAAVTAAGAVS